MTKGEHLQGLLEDAVFKHLLDDSPVSVSTLLRTPSLRAIQVTLQLVLLCKYSKKRDNSEQNLAEHVSVAVTSHWGSLESWAEDVVIKKALLVELLKATVQMFPPSLAVGCLGRDPRNYKVSFWILKQLESEPLDQLAELISLLPCAILHGEPDTKLRSTLRNVQINKFPVSCDELKLGSAERNTFVAVYKSLLRAMVDSGSLGILHIISSAAADPKHACADQITPALQQFMKRHREERQVEALQEMFAKFLDECIVETIIGIVERFMMPMLLEASRPAVIRFYTERIQTIINFLENSPTINDQEWMVKKILARKIGAIQLTEPLFNRLDKKDLEAADNPIVRQAKVPKDKLLPNYFATFLNDLRQKTVSGSEEVQHLARKMQCCGYNALMTFLCNTNQSVTMDKVMQMFNVLLFSERRFKVWQKLVPSQPKYTFPIEFDDYPRMKKAMVQIRGLVKSNESASTSYLPSQSLFNSSLHEDITLFDFSMYRVRDEDRLNQVLNEDQRLASVTLDLEMDCLNNHECMATLCGVVKYLNDTFPVVVGLNGMVAVLPDWMGSLRSSLVASDQPDNCRAFIVKLIVNCQSYFKLAAEYFLGPILQTILDDCLGTGLNYLIHDIVRMLCDWSTLYKPISSQEQALASEFLRRLVRHTPNERTAVFKYNVEVVKCIVTAWETFESLPYQELLDLLSQAPEPGHLLADVFLSHNILPFNSTGKQSYYKSLLGNLNSSNQRLYKTCGVVIGKIFKILSDGGSHPLADEDKAFFTQVQEAICLEDNRQGSTAPKYLEHFIYCLHSIQKNYSAIVNKFVTQCISQLMRMSSSFQVMLLEALTSALDSDFHSDAFSLLRSEIPTLLKNHSYPDTQLATLKLIDKLMPSLTVVQMSELLPSVKRFLTHKRRDCRGTVYNIAKWMYNTYVGSSDATTVSLYKEARIFLLAGLADTDQQLQEDIFSFINDQLPRSENERLVEILSKLYSPDHEDTFLATVIKLLLQICELEPEFKENIFTDPLSSCAFEKYNVSGSWRTQHAAFVPMFADTLTSQMTSASLGSLSDISNQIRATQTLSSSSLLISVSNSNEEELSLYSFGGASTSGTSLSQSYKQGYGFGVDFLSPIDAADGKKLPEEKLMRMRFLRDKQKLSRKCAERNIVKAAHQKKQQSEKMKQREGQVTLRRNYRKGDLPDIEIPRSEFIKSLQSLANRDQLIARQLLVAVCHVIKVEAFALSSALDNILQTTTSCHPVLIASVLELSLLYKEQCKTPSSIIAEVSKKSQQMSLGALLVEAKLSGSCEPRPAKRVRNNYLSPEHQDWTHLAEIYRSMEEKDIVQGLFEEKIAGACAQSVRSALLSEDKNHWKAALKQYDDCINKDNSIDNFLDEARFKCFANLSQWRELNETLKIKKLKNNLDTVWDTDWNSEHSLSWLFLSEIIRCQESSVLHLAEDFSTALRRWMDDSSRSSYIKERFGEYLSMVFVVTDNFQRGKLTCEHSLQKFLLCWQQLDSMSYSLRVHHLLCLGSLMDLHLFLQLPPSSLSQGGDKVKKLLNQWLQSSPSSSDSLVAWETRAAYRYIFATKLEQKANTESLKKKLKQFQLEVQLKTADCAFEQKNVIVMRKYLNKIHEKQLPGAIKRRRQLAMSRAELLRACVEPDISAKMSRTLSVFDRIQKLRRNENMGLDLHLHTADFYSTLLSAFNASPSIMNTLSQTDRERLNHHLNGSDEDISAQLVAKVVVSLEDAVKSSPNVSLADSYLRLARFCHQIEDSLYHEKLIESLLRAMKHGSSEARRLFPILLQLPLLSHQQVFKSESEQVAEWMFLGWVSQLLANLDSEWGCVLAPLVLRMAKAYPVALQFPFLLSQDMNNDSATSDTVNKLKDLLKLSNVTETLVRALSCVCQPHLCLIYHIDKLRSALSQDEEQISKAYAQMTLEAYPAEENTLVKGVAFNIVEKFKNQIEGLQGKFMMKMLSPKEYSKRLLKIREDVHMESTSTEINNERAKLTQLAFFSPWLMDDYVGGVEVPGQYTGEERPLTDHHLIISRFDRHVEPQISLRAPIKITILGNDGKKHGYLVKFGEDLRQDQRLQQLFTLMSHLLRASTTGHRRLSVDTYTVSPLNSRLGLIQWVDHTTALKDFMLTSEELKTNFDLTNKSYDKWFKSRCNTSDPSPFYNSIKKDESVSVLQKAQKKIPSHMLRDAVWKLAASPEAFIHLRAEMLASYGCMSICHWLLGVGDRHLSNILVRQDCGRLLGIDFGHAFGTATQMLAVPELVPCRLTSQLINLASPFNTTGLLKESMVHTLQVIRENRRVLLAAMTVFIQEPSVDWLKAARRHQELNNVPLSNNAQWYPEERISESRRKLEGAHPRSIMEKELEGGHRNRPHYQKLLQFLREAYIDVDMPADNLSSRQQVECLIAHATNEFLLSISFSGWMPWV